jgi:nicotinamidase/pyrazinamidase
MNKLRRTIAESRRRTSTWRGDMVDLIGPDRTLPCGCQVINGAICFVFPSDVSLDTKNLYKRPGRFIPVEGPMFKPQEGDALLVVDLQRDFCPGGALPAPEGNLIVPLVNEIAGAFLDAGQPVYMSADWHPEGTKHFEKWPVHCVQNTPGAKFHSAVDARVTANARIVLKGMRADADGYSAFEGETVNGTFAEDLKLNKINRLVVCGLATDYCVKATVLDALTTNDDIEEVIVPINACAGVDLSAWDSLLAVAEMASYGAQVIVHEG